MAQRRSPNRIDSSSANPSFACRKYALRRSASSRTGAFGHVDRRHRSFSGSHGLDASNLSSSTDNNTLRPVLVPLHPNLRRLPSRLFYAQKGAMRDASNTISVKAGTKRKRVAGRNENTHSGGRSTRGSGRLKRMRSSSQQYTSDDDDAASSMCIDAPSSCPLSGSSDAEDDDADAEDSSVEHLINDAVPRELLRLRKDELVNLYIAAGLSDDAELLTKQEIVDAIVDARDDVAEIPPSSSRGGTNSSDYSSDDGHMAGDEETDIVPRQTMPNGLMRRATATEYGRVTERPIKGRSFSMGYLLAENHSTEGKKAPKFSVIIKGTPEGGGTTSRRKGSSRSSSTPSNSSPPATRLRSRKVSTESNPSASNKSKGKGKQVEFCDELQTKLSRSAPREHEKDDDLADLADLESSQKTVTTSLSPRRLRSNQKGMNGHQPSKGRPESSEDSTPRAKVTKKAKGKFSDLKRDEDEDEDGENDESQEEDEVDELISSASATPPPLQGRRTPVKRRLRPRRVAAHAPSSDGDDEGEEDEEEEPEEVDEDEEIGGVGEEGDGDSTTDAGAEEDEEQTIVVQPRTLRNGKIVGEGEMEESADDEEEEEESTDADVDIDVEIETEESEDNDEVMEDVDLTVATAKTLVRLRRDDLVRLCETRDLDVAGTKPQLAEALLQWRDRNSNGFSSPSSAGTARPPSTSRRRPNGHNRSRSQTKSQTPVLLRPGNVHIDGPRTPSSQNRRDVEHELELDLESLGLDDREISPDKLTKLEKIGSGGFKDVFIGRFKGRKIAISEFRGQLSEMDIKELKLLGGFNHPNIVRFVGVSIPENTRETPVMIVSELCSNGDLFDYIRKTPPPPLHKVLGMMLDIARGLEYLHMRKPSVIHRDCKSSNILITAKGTAKIADFGLAKVKQSTRSMVRSLVGTVNWQAPELWHAHPKYNYKVDVFSCAMVYWEILQWHLPNQKFPWEGMNEHAIYEVVGTKRQRPSVSGLRKQWCPEIVDLIERMWAQEHQERPTMSEVVEALEQLLS